MKNAIITLLSFFILSVCFAVIFWVFQCAMWFLLLIFIAFYIVGEFVKLLKIKRYEFEANDKIMIFLASIGIFITLITPYVKPSIKEQFNRLYFPENSIDFSEKIITPITSNAVHYKLIFAFDNSKEGFSDNVLSVPLKDEYDKYRKKIRVFFDKDFTDIEFSELLPPKNKNITFGKLLKAKLASDLIEREDTFAEFIIMKIGNPVILYDTVFLIADEKNIKIEIERLLKTENTDDWTDFVSFLDKLKIKIGDNKKKNENELSDCVVFIYSDFFHDVKGTETDEHIEIIKERLKNDLPNKTIVQICFIDGHLNKKNRGGKYILESIPTSNFEKHFFVDKNNKDKEVPTRIVKTEYQPWYYLNNEKKAVDTEYKLLFDKKGYSIRLLDSIKGFFINEEEIKYNIWKTFNFNKTIVLEYQGIALKEEVVLFEISHNKIHYLLPFKFYQESGLGKNIPLIIVIFFGLFIGIWGIWKK